MTWRTVSHLITLDWLVAGPIDNEALGTSGQQMTWRTVSHLITLDWLVAGPIDNEALGTSGQQMTWRTAELDANGLRLIDDTPHPQVATTVL
jgi:hypothetical protein